MSISNTMWMDQICRSPPIWYIKWLEFHEFEFNWGSYRCWGSQNKHFLNRSTILDRAFSSGFLSHFASVNPSRSGEHSKYLSISCLLHSHNNCWPFWIYIYEIHSIWPQITDVKRNISTCAGIRSKCVLKCYLKERSDGFEPNEIVIMQTFPRTTDGYQNSDAEILRTLTTSSRILGHF